MAKKTFNCAVIGCGFISPAHIEAYLSDENARLVALCDHDAQWLKYCGEKYGITKLYTNYKDLLRDPEIEVVSVCVPNGYHAEITIDALNNGKHVLCEKPMAINAAQANTMIEAKNKSGKKLMIGQNQRFIPAAQMMKRLYDQGAFGEVYHIRTGWRRPLGMMPSPEGRRDNGQKVDRNWYNDKAQYGGVLRDLGVHMLDLAMYITGFPKVISADAAGYRKFKPDTKGKNCNMVLSSEDMVSSLIKFDNGMSVNMEVSFGSLISHEAIFTNVYGTRMGAERNDDDLSLIKTDDGFSYRVEAADLSGEKPFSHCANEFLDCLVNQKEVPVRPEESLLVIEALDLIYESIG